MDQPHLFCAIVMAGLDILLSSLQWHESFVNRTEFNIPLVIK